MVVELFRKLVLQFLKEYVRENLLVERRHINDGDTRMKFRRSGVVSGKCCPTLSDDDKLRSRNSFSETRNCVLREPKMYVTHAFSAGRKTVSSFLLIRSESDEEEVIWLEKVLLLFRCVVAADKESGELAFVRSMKCLPPL